MKKTRKTIKNDEVIIKERTDRTTLDYKKPSNAYGKAGLILGIIGFFIGGPLLGIPGIVFSSIGLAKKQKHSGIGLALSIMNTTFLSAIIMFFLTIMFFAIIGTTI